MNILDSELYSKYIVVLDPVINNSREIDGYDARLKPIKQSYKSVEELDYECKINILIYMLDRLALFFESLVRKNDNYSINLYVSFQFQYTQEPRVMIFVDALNDVLKSKNCYLILTFPRDDFSSNLGLLNLSDFNYSMCSSIKLGIDCFDISPPELLEIMQYLNIKVVKFNLDLRFIKKLLIEHMPVYRYSQIRILFEGVDDEGLFYEMSSLGNGCYKGKLVGSKIYLL
ncbi:hypothetical protein L4D09_27870 [Photobacterium makurazakiensis]|uniref:hypothetical protein n=1 Tax=Photobacterium makurazakiensis TaxID=2910234 RepID=UPI003D0EDCB4